MKKAVCIAVVSALAALAAGRLFVGCENSGQSLDLEPSSATLSATNNTLLLSVDVPTNSTLLPLSWSVSDAALGTLTENTGTSVVYQANPVLGVNKVIVRSVDGSAATATITQSEVAQNNVPFTVVPTIAVLSDSTNTVVFRVTITANGNAATLLPFQWQENNVSLGSITTASGLTATYTANQGAVGDNTITVVAADGSQYSVEVEQQ